MNRSSRENGNGLQISTSMETAGFEPAHRFPRGWGIGLPLVCRGIIQGFALVDSDTYEWAHGIRWYLHSRGGWRYVRGTHGEFLHRQVLGLELGDPRSVDHINRDTLDNRTANLRVVTVAQNAQNQGSRGGTSQHRGVIWDKARSKWRAQATLKGRFHIIGRFDTELEAARAAADWRAVHMPFSAEARAGRQTELDWNEIQGLSPTREDGIGDG